MPSRIQKVTYLCKRIRHIKRRRRGEKDVKVLNTLTYKIFALTFDGAAGMERGQSRDISVILSYHSSHCVNRRIIMEGTVVKCYTPVIHIHIERTVRIIRDPHHKDPCGIACEDFLTVGNPSEGFL